MFSVHAAMSFTRSTHCYACSFIVLLLQFYHCFGSNLSLSLRETLFVKLWGRVSKALIRLPDRIHTLISESLDNKKKHTVNFDCVLMLILIMYFMLSVPLCSLPTQ